MATYGYDVASRLANITYTKGTTTLGDIVYTSDASGSRTTVNGSWARTALPAAMASATYDAANRLTAWGGATLTYDLNGKLLSDGQASYTWNARNQLTGMSGGTNAAFTYDGFGRRRGKTVGGTTTNFLYDGANFVQELTSGGTPTANLLTGLRVDELFTRTDAAGTRTALVDGLGSTLELADNAGTLQTHYTFGPFGTTTASGAASTNSTQFSGRENDGTGLYFSRARFLNPVSGRFISEDPIGLAGGLNLYSYVGNDPQNATDPTGLFTCENHQKITQLAANLAGLSADLTKQLVANVCSPDDRREALSGKTSETHRHAMGGIAIVKTRSGRDRFGYETCSEAYKGSEDLLRELLKSGQESDLSDILHMLQDQWASGHRFQPWDGNNLVAHTRGDRSPDDYAINGARDATTKFLKDYKNKKVGGPGDYLHNFCQ